MKKYIALILALIFLTGCSGTFALLPFLPDSPARPSSSAVEPQSDPEQTARDEKKEAEEAHREELLAKYADVLTDYDKVAVPSKVHFDIAHKTDFHSSIIEEDMVSLSKKDNVITATGHYYLDGVPKGFKCIYKDNGKDYIPVEINCELDPSEIKEKTDLDMDPNAYSVIREYPVVVTSGISLTANHSGEGKIRIVVEDAGGNEVQEVFNDAGEISETRNAAGLEPGSYTIRLYCSGGQWGFRYSSY